jgi:hypothetical protein
MPVCPKCGTEYRRGVRQCADCGSTLVEWSLEDRKPRPQDEAGFEQVVLCVVQGEIHARLLQNALAEEGIPSRVQVGGDEFGATLPLGQLFPGGTTTLTQVWVNKRDLERAQAVREAYEGKSK